MKKTGLGTKMLAVLLAAVLGAMAPGCQSGKGAASGQAGDAGRPQNSQTAAAAPDADTIVLTDTVGREVTLPYPVERCAVALRYTNELIRACGAIDKVIAVDLNTAQDREYWGMFDPENVIGKGQRELDYEKVIELAPQVLILPANGSYEEAIEKLEPFGIQVFVISGYDTDDFVNQCENIGKMFQVEGQANAFCSYFTEKLDYIDAQLADVPWRTYYYEGNADYQTILPGDTFYRMFELAHAQNIFAEDAQAVNADEVDPEAVLQKNPDVIVKCITPNEARAGTGLYEPPAKEQFQQSYEGIVSRPGWDSISAVKNDDVYFMTQFSHGGACKLVGTMYIAKWLYPDLLPELDPDEVFRAWMEDFQGFENIAGHFYTAKELKA